MMTQAGELVAGWGLSGGLTHADLLPGSSTWDRFFPSVTPVYGTPMLLAKSDLDVTGAPSASAPQFSAPYGVGNWTIDLDDVIYMAAHSSMSEYADYITELYHADNPYAPHDLFPLHVGLGDVNGDRRFNQDDRDALADLIGAWMPEDLVHDYDGDLTIAQGDVDILDQLLTTVVPGGGASCCSIMACLEIPTATGTRIVQT